MECIFNKLLRSSAEIAALVKTLGFSNQRLQSKNFYKENKDRFDLFVNKLRRVLFDVFNGHQKHDILYVSFSHTLDLWRVLIIVLGLFT